MNRLKSLMILCLLFMPAIVSAQTQRLEEILIWPKGAPGSEGKSGEEKTRLYDPTGDHIVSNIHKPSITTFLPDESKSTGAAIVIAPGGGHRELWIDHEGYNPAQWLSENGVAAIVLKYRLSKEEGSSYDVNEHSVRDMQRAIQYVRSRAMEWRIDPERIGVMGFSAGGEVAAMTSQLSDLKLDKPQGLLLGYSSVPNFHALIYPGRGQQIKPSINSTPVFIVCGYGDSEGISKGMAEVYMLYKEAKIPAELHIYANAGHGFGMRKGDKDGASKWISRLYEWMEDSGFLKSM